MAKVVTATEAKNRLGALMNEVTSTNQPVLIELRGHPNAALISAAELERFEALDRQARLTEMLRELEQFRLNATPVIVRPITDQMNQDEVDQIVADELTESRREQYRQRVRERRVAEPTSNYSAEDDSTS
jgi:prevent-host-death family protein